ncbi:MAG: LCP family protein [Candidatus Doudnabacteria bacterium]|nr:LCP family protein [Candidatus Doudnabacteria bacterium]
MTNFDGLNSENRHMGSYQPRARRSKLKKFAIFVIVFLVLGSLAWAGVSVISKTSKIFTNKKSIFTRIGGLFISNDKPLAGEDSGTVNILLLGIGGEGHDGAYLTDTMIVASLKLETDEVVLTSIPRDWLVTIPNHGLNKINAVYAYGLQDNPKDPDAPGRAAIAAAEKVTGFTIPYYAIVDFKGFVQAVDHVGGVDVTVDRTFSDATFPNDFPYDTKGYLSPVTFTKGPAHLNGREALIFARSRHSSNFEEASDFARSERQKKILVSLKDKLLNLNIGNLSTLNNLLSDFSDNFRTNLEAYELLRLSKIAKDISGENVYSLALEPQGTLICDTTIDQLTGKPYIRPATPEPSPTPSPTPTSSTSTSTGTKSSTSTTTGTKTQTPSTTTTPKTTSPTPAPTPNPTSSPTNGQIPMYIVEPCAGKTLADINHYLLNYWETARLKKEGATIEIQNSTGKTAATASWRHLSDLGLDVTFVSFPGKLPFERTIIYDNSKGAKPKTLQYLKDNFDLTQADVQFTNSKADFVIVIGNDAL